MDKNIHDYLNTLKEMILDEKKLVTYVSLSKEMCLHVNECKTLLSQMVEDYRRTNCTDNQLNVNYIISGLLADNKAHTTVCNEKELSAFKSKYKSVFYEHLYSVSVGNPSVDNVSYMAVNRFEDFPLYSGLIKGLSCLKRTSDEIGNLKTNSQEIVANNQTKSVQTKAKEDMKNGIPDIKQEVKAQEIKSEINIKSESKSPKNEVTNNNTQKTDVKNVKSQKGIAGFFNKPGTTNQNKKLNGSSENVLKNNNDVKPEIKKSPKIKLEKMDIDEDAQNKDSENKKSLPQSKKESLTQIKKTAKLDKKRKRVLHVSDSESEDEKNDPFKEEPIVEQESEDEIPPTPLASTVKITSGIMNPKKRRKIVDKTYTDEDGYILTKKEEVYESCSEPEEEVHVKENVQQANKVKTEVSPPGKKNGIKNGKKKIPSPQKGKQSTLMSFFKKV